MMYSDKTERRDERNAETGDSLRYQEHASGFPHPVDESSESMSRGRGNSEEYEGITMEAGSENRNGKYILKNLFRFFRTIFLIAVLFPWVLILVLKWIPPPLSSIMIFQRFSGHVEHILYEWTDWSDISPVLPLAVIAAEDQRFLDHHGFDFESIREAWSEYQAGIRTRGASTISQQVAKNLFLWPGKDFIRKGLEAYLAMILELLWTKRRILETYVNIAEFAPGIYGVGAASTVLLDTRPALLTPDDAALMAAVLPNPTRLRLRQPSSYVLSRRDFILNQMMKIGGVQLIENM